jgi:hypothetical protein
MFQTTKSPNLGLGNPRWIWEMAALSLFHAGHEQNRWVFEASTSLNQHGLYREERTAAINVKGNQFANPWFLLVLRQKPMSVS